MGPAGVGELLARVTAALPGGGEHRPGQVQMAEAVARAIDEGRHLVVQAGTGTGKSLAYLVPAVLSGRRVVVATATKALQDQLAQKDLPALAAALGRPIAFAVLKGRGNYLCRQRAAEMEGRGVQTDLGMPPADRDATADPGAAAPVGGTPRATPGAEADPGHEAEADPGHEADPTGRLVDQLRTLLDWARRSETGDRADLSFEPHPRAWAMLSVGPRECPGAARCPEGGSCFAERARERAAEADVVVVNLHLYGAHLASGGAVLPSHDVVVFDEAHELEDVMTSSLGVDLSPGRLRALHTSARALLAEDDGAAVDLAGTATHLGTLLAERAGHRVFRAPAGPGTAAAERAPGGRERPFFGTGAGGDSAGTPGDAAGTPGDAADGPEDPDAALAGVLELAAARVEEVRARLAAGRTHGGGDTPEGDRDARRTRALVGAGTLAGDLARVAARREDEVAWVDGAPGAPSLRLSPVDVGPQLAAMLWGSVTAVLTSATVPPRLEAHVGLEGSEVTRLDVGSPFDFRAHSLLYVARHLPDRRSPRAEGALTEELAALIEAAGGRTLALFTSRRATESSAQALRARLPYRLLVQGELPKPRLLESFADDETSCLFATLGFWQGVDVPGRSLSLVTVDRLPFGRPDDPLLEARRERAGDAAFFLVDLPRAATLLAQGVGRLVRSAEDRGVVAVLDPRLATARYRRTLLDALPPMRRTVERAEVAAFFDRVLGPDR